MINCSGLAHILWAFKSPISSDFHSKSRQGPVQPSPFTGNTAIVLLMSSDAYY